MLQHRSIMLNGLFETNAQTKHAEPNALDTTPTHSSSRAVLMEILANTFLSLVQKFIFLVHNVCTKSSARLSSQGK